MHYLITLVKHLLQVSPHTTIQPFTKLNFFEVLNPNSKIQKKKINNLNGKLQYIYIQLKIALLAYLTFETTRSMTHTNLYLNFGFGFIFVIKE